MCIELYIDGEFFCSIYVHSYMISTWSERRRRENRMENSVQILFGMLTLLQGNIFVPVAWMSMCVNKGET